MSQQTVLNFFRTGESEIGVTDAELDEICKKISKQTYERFACKDQ